MKKTMSKKGFTLIELLIVIAIIGILAVALLPQVLGAPARARDAARRADVNNIVAAIESYNASNGSYPSDPACLTSVSVLADYLKGDVPTGDDNVDGIADCDKGVYFYCPLTGTGVGEYYVAAKMETEAATDGFYPSTTIITATSSCKDLFYSATPSAVLATEALGNVYISKQ